VPDGDGPPLPKPLTARAAQVKLEHSHTKEDIRKRLAAPRRSSYLRDWIYGGIDGVVTTFAVVAGVAGANLSPTVIVILGFANLVADAFSMAASNYSGTKAERDAYDRQLAMERRHIALVPEGEREEVRQIFAAKGLAGEDLDRVVAAITADRVRWETTMLVEEHGLAPISKSPIKAAVSTFAAFVLCGLAPLLPYLFGWTSLQASAALAGAVFFAIGSARSRWSTDRWWRSGFETLVIGAGAAGLAFLVGYGLNAAFGMN
jgi:VIT1/CCC1 family predicted Fe2+/Mn2+ transporter